MDKKKKFEKFEFIDTSGKETNFSCDESKLANYFGKNPEAPNFLTHVFFKKEVLDKYYGKPSKYSIDDGYLFYTKDNGIHEWAMPIDNNAKGCIMIYLGDLAKLPYEEQKHWKLYNIVEGKRSKVSFKRDIKAEFCSPTEPVLFFKERLNIFNEKWKEKFGWDLFKQLNVEDEHHWKSLKIPTEEQKEFDEKILSLTKIIIDSLNLPKMKENLIFEKEDKSIFIFEKYIIQKHKFISPEMIQYLKNLQELRSKGSAHRKGSDYQKIYKKFDEGSLSKTFEKIIVGAITLLNTLENNLLEKEKNEKLK